MAGSTANPVVDIADVINKLSPTIFGKTDATSEQISNLFDPTSLGQSNAIFDILKQRGSSTAAADSVVQDILYRAQLAFAPVLGEEKSAGMYNTTVKKQLAQESIARATAASADAVFKMQQQSLDAAAQITNAQIQNSRTTNKSGGAKQQGQGKNLAVSIGASLAAGEAYKKAKGMFGAKSTAAVDPDLADAVKDYQVSSGMKAGEGDVAAGGGFDPNTIMTGIDTGSTQVAAVDTGTAVDAGGSALAGVAIDSSSGLTDVGLDASADSTVTQASMMNLDSGPAADIGSSTVLDTSGDAAGNAAADPSFWDSIGGMLGFADGGAVKEKKLGMIRSTAGASPNPNQPSAARIRLEGAVNPVVDAISEAITNWRARVSAPDAPEKQKEEPGYADGGSIEDRVAYTEGSNQVRAGQTMAPNIVAGGIGAIPVVSRTMPRAVNRNLNTMAGEDLDKILTQQADAFNKAATSSAPTATDTSPSVGPAPAGIGTVAGVAAALASINAPVALITSIMAAVANANAPTDVSIDPTENSPMSQNAMVAEAAIDATNEGPVSDASPTDAAEGGAAAAGADAASADAGSDAGSSGGDAGGSGDFFGGGLVIGKDAEDFSGVDKEKINVTPDEYVLPADIVNLLGKDNLDTLLEKFHKPVRTAGRR